MECRKCKKEMVRKSCMCRDSAYPDLPEGKGVVWHCKECNVAYLDSGRMSAPGRRIDG